MSNFFRVRECEPGGVELVLVDADGTVGDCFFLTKSEALSLAARLRRGAGDGSLRERLWRPVRY